MASKRRRHIPSPTTDRPRKDRVAVAKKMQIEEMNAKEADMEARNLESLRRVVVVCRACHQRNEFELANRVPVESCGNCGARLSLQTPASPQVVSR